MRLFSSGVSATPVASWVTANAETGEIGGGGEDVSSRDGERDRRKAYTSSDVELLLLLGDVMLDGARRHDVDGLGDLDRVSLLLIVVRVGRHCVGGWERSERWIGG